MDNESLRSKDQESLSRRDLKRALGFLAERTVVGHRVLVHCDEYGTSADEALKIIQERRPKADPDPVVWRSIHAPTK